MANMRTEVLFVNREHKLFTKKRLRKLDEEFARNCHSRRSLMTLYVNKINDRYTNMKL